MEEPLRYAFSKEEMLKWANDFLIETYGPIPKEENEQDKWFARYGMLISFVSGPFPK